MFVWVLEEVHVRSIDLTDLKSRFRTQVAQQRGRPAQRGSTSTRGGRKQGQPIDILTLHGLKLSTLDSYIEAPPLPTEDPAPPKGEKAQMEDFLDDLLG